MARLPMQCNDQSFPLAIPVACVALEFSHAPVSRPSEEIAAECARIRAGWHEQEEQRRRRWSIAPPVEVVEVVAGSVVVE